MTSFLQSTKTRQPGSKERHVPARGGVKDHLDDQSEEKAFMPLPRVIMAKPRNAPGKGEKAITPKVVRRHAKSIPYLWKHRPSETSLRNQSMYLIS
jgi:hypothetical protein